MELAKYFPATYEQNLALRKTFHDFLRIQPRKNLQQEQTENCSGDYIRNAKNCRLVFHCYDAEDCAYGEHVWRGAKDCVDANTAGRNAELIYESTNSGIDSYSVKFSRYCWGSHHTEYSNQCKSGRYLFGCVSLKPNASYCILNKQYREEEYHLLVSKIKKDMSQRSEYGEFFPLAQSLFGYNNSVGFYDAPLSKDVVLGNGWKWEEQESGVFGTETQKWNSIPRCIHDLEESIVDEVLACRKCSRNYRIISKELAFYRLAQLPLPQHCPFCRHHDRLLSRHRKVLHRVMCTSCQEPIETTLNLEEYPAILCARCYQHVIE